MGNTGNGTGGGELMAAAVIAGGGVLTFGSLVAYFTMENLGAAGWTGPAGVAAAVGTVGGLVAAGKVSKSRRERLAIEAERKQWAEFASWFHPRLETALWRVSDPFSAMATWTGEQVRLGRPANPATGDPGEWPRLLPFRSDKDLPPGVELGNNGLWLTTADGLVLMNDGIAPTRAGARIQLWVPEGGWSVREFAARLPNIASALDVPEAQIIAADGRRVVLDLRVTNPLADAVRYPGPEQVSGIEELTALLDGARVGMRDDGGVHRLRVRGNHLLFTGLTGSGKSGAVQSLLLGLAPLIPAGVLEVHMVDLKRMEMAAGARLYETWSKTPAEALVALQLAVNVLDERRDAYASVAELTGEPTRKHFPSPGDPHLMLVIEEAMALLKIPGKAQITVTLPVRGNDGVVRPTEVKGKIIELAAEMLIELLTQARAVGITVVLTTQNAAKEVMELLRDLVSLVVGLRQAGPQQEQMTFGHGARERGVRATEITAEEVGTAFVLSETGGPAQRTRFYDVHDQDITQTVRIFGRPPGVPSRTQIATQAALTGAPMPAAAAADSASAERGNVLQLHAADAEPPLVDRLPEEKAGHCKFCGKKLEQTRGGRPALFCQLDENGNPSDHRQQYHRLKKRLG
ncbi:FtsK/SpoIIIE domain-containing protein [Nocardia sp. NPDC050697]|uniref:FtsK/SpoIIIE domain-containing protein n=1 Tax=Nocardia sp. NPDC050697 TaxID=3155158 RepID=UPI0033C6E7C4